MQLLEQRVVVLAIELRGCGTLALQQQKHLLLPLIARLWADALQGLEQRIPRRLP